jgi:hypothetical protein
MDVFASARLLVDGAGKAACGGGVGLGFVLGARRQGVAEELASAWGEV